MTPQVCPSGASRSLDLDREHEEVLVKVWPHLSLPLHISVLPCPAVWFANLSGACEVSPSSCCQGFGLFPSYCWIPGEVIILWSHYLIAEERVIHILLEYLAMYRVVYTKAILKYQEKTKMRSLGSAGT